MLNNYSYRFCTLDPLLTSMQGDNENGLVITGKRVHKTKELLPAQTIMNTIMMEFRAYFSN